MISTRWRLLAPVVAALSVTIGVSACAASRPPAETATTAVKPVDASTSPTDATPPPAQAPAPPAVTLVPTAPAGTSAITTSGPPTTPPRPAAGGGAPATTLARPTDV